MAYLPTYLPPGFSSKKDWSSWKGSQNWGSDDFSGSQPAFLHTLYMTGLQYGLTEEILLLLKPSQKTTVNTSGLQDPDKKLESVSRRVAPQMAIPCESCLV